MPQASVQLAEIKPLLDAAVERGIAVPHLDALHASAIAEDAHDGEIPIADYFRIQRDIALASDDLTAILSSRKLTFRTGHFLVAQMQQANSLLAAMETLVEHINMMHGDAYNSLRYSDWSVSLVVDDSSFPYRFRNDQRLVELIGDCLLIKIHCLLDSLTGGIAQTALKRVRLKRKRGVLRRPQNHFWQVPIEYGGAAYEIVYGYDTACQPARIQEEVDLSADGLFSRVISYLESDTATLQQKSATARAMDLIDDGMRHQANVAERLNMSVATLRRRLSEEGTSFRQLLLSARLRRAEAMLRRGCSVAQTSEELNYSDIRAFNRAFKRWKGLTPAAFAQTCRP